jgi:AraC-like DNA-binding protein
MLYGISWFMPTSRKTDSPDILPARPCALTGDPQSELPVWRAAGAAWQQLAGGFRRTGFSFEWHQWEAVRPMDWSASFHPASVEICLNLLGNGWVEAGGGRIEFVSDTAGFFFTNGVPVRAERSGGSRHEFLSVEFSLEFLRSRLGSDSENLHPTLRRCLASKAGVGGVSRSAAIIQRQRDLLRSLLHPPVLRGAQRLWYESKALEFAAEFLFAPDEGGETLCTRAQRLSSERVATAKQVMLEHLAEPLSLEDLGRIVGCSHFYLSRTFTRETGMTISQWLRQARLDRAAELLRSGKCNVTEAAMEVGYSSLSHFSQAFHDEFGCCPGLYPLRTPAQKTERPHGATAK